MYDVDKVRADFPILSREVHGKPLVYLDNAATTQKPLCVLDAMRDEYLNENANVHRGVHYLSVQATELHEQARETVRRFLNAGSSSEIVFTRGAAEGLNLIASTFTEAMMVAWRRGDSHGHGASFQHSALAVGGKPQRHKASRHTHDRQRHPRYGGL